MAKSRTNMPELFLSTPCAGRATMWQTGSCKNPSYFYPRPPRGGRLNRPSRTPTLANFYPRPPRGGRPASRQTAIHLSVFLSTPSARRATLYCCKGRLCFLISIHALREEGDAGRGGGWDAPYHFYPRPPRGGRRKVHFGLHGRTYISIHALREEGDWITKSTVRNRRNFYPRPPRGGRQCTES